jgi:hypothetical protein
MAEACDGLQIMASAYEKKDRKSFEMGYDQVHGYVLAGEQAEGDKAKEADVEAVWNAQRVLHVAAYAPAELNEGASIWEGRALAEEDQAHVQQGIEVCADY